MAKTVIHNIDVGCELDPPLTILVCFAYILRTIPDRHMGPKI